MKTLGIAAIILGFLVMIYSLGAGIGASGMAGAISTTIIGLAFVIVGLVEYAAWRIVRIAAKYDQHQEGGFK